MKDRVILPEAEPFYFPGGPTGCLLIHGFTGVPKEMLDLGKHLNQQGHTVLGVRLAGHGTDINDMIRMRYQDWIASVEDGWNLLASHTEKIFIMGLSMGGVLSYTAAARLPAAGVIGMSTPYLFPKVWVRKAPWLIPLMSPFLRSMAKSEGKWFTPGVAEDHFSYDRNPCRPAYELYKLLEVMRGGLPAINIPSLVIHSKDDDYVFSEHAEPLYNAIGSQDKELFWVENANHVITRDGDTAVVFNKVANFIRTKS